MDRPPDRLCQPRSRHRRWGTRWKACDRDFQRRGNVLQPLQPGSWRRGKVLQCLQPVPWPAGYGLAGFAIGRSTIDGSVCIPWGYPGQNQPRLRCSSRSTVAARQQQEALVENKWVILNGQDLMGLLSIVEQRRYLHALRKHIGRGFRCKTDQHKWTAVEAHENERRVPRVDQCQGVAAFDGELREKICIADL